MVLTGLIVDALPVIPLPKPSPSGIILGKFLLPPMTRIPFDAFSKQFLEELLDPLGSVETSRKVPGEAHWVDVFFIPRPQPAPTPITLGLLGKIATTPCLIEPFRHPPTHPERHPQLHGQVVWGPCPGSKGRKPH
jgi:hypothetical protein